MKTIFDRIKLNIFLNNGIELNNNYSFKKSYWFIFNSFF